MDRPGDDVPMKRRPWNDKVGNAGQTASIENESSPMPPWWRAPRSKGVGTAFTLDWDYGAYRIRGRHPFRVIPQA